MKNLGYILIGGTLAAGTLAMVFTMQNAKSTAESLLGKQTDTDCRLARIEAAIDGNRIDNAAHPATNPCLKAP